MADRPMLEQQVIKVGIPRLNFFPEVVISMYMHKQILSVLNVEYCINLLGKRLLGWNIKAAEEVCTHSASATCVYGVCCFVVCQ